MSTDPLRAKALACLREGRVSVKRVVSDRDTLAVLEVMAVVASSRERVAPHIVDLRQGAWTCTYPTRSGADGAPCAHLTAVQLALGLVAWAENTEGTLRPLVDLQPIGGAR